MTYKVVWWLGLALLLLPVRLRVMPAIFNRHPFLAPPSAVETEIDKTIVTLTIPYGKKWLEIHGVGLNKTFRDLHMAIIELGLPDPEMILFQVEPNDVDKWMRAYDLTNELLRAL